MAIDGCNFTIWIMVGNELKIIQVRRVALGTFTDVVHVWGDIIYNTKVEIKGHIMTILD